MIKQDIETAYDNLKNAKIAEWEVSQKITALELEKKDLRNKTRLAQDEVDSLGK